MLNFSRWVEWENKDMLGDSLNEQGLYMLAHFEHNVPETVDLVPEIVYIGITGKKDTSDKTLRKRLSEFNSVVNGNAENHSGGKTYFRKFGGIQPNLYITVSAEKSRKGLERACYLLMMERILIWRFVRKFCKRPTCNSE